MLNISDTFSKSFDEANRNKIQQNDYINHYQLENAKKRVEIKATLNNAKKFDQQATENQIKIMELKMTQQSAAKRDRLRSANVMRQQEHTHLTTPSLTTHRFNPIPLPVLRKGITS